MALGLGAIDENLISVIAGTWGLNQLATSAPVTDGSLAAVVAGPRPGDFVVTDAGPTSASAFEWLVSPFSAAPRAVAGTATRCSICATGKCCGREGTATFPYFLPYLNGRLEQPQARACFIGLASWHGLPKWCGPSMRASLSNIAAKSIIC